MRDTSTLDLHRPPRPRPDAARPTPRLATRSLRTWVRSWIAPWDRGERAVHEFTERLKTGRSPAESRVALVYLAQRLSGALRVELEVDDGPGGRPRRVACWPEVGASAGRGRPSGTPLTLPLRFGGETRGVLRLLPRGPRQWPSRVVRRLEVLCALAAAAERTPPPAEDGPAVRDPITGAYYGPVVMAFLTHALSQARRRGEPLSLLCIGVDGLAEARSERGPEIADAALRGAARATLATLRAGDLVGRIDGDRLVAILPGASAADAPTVAEAVRRAIAEAGQAAPTTVPVTASVGVVSFRDHAREAGPLLALASETLARARADGPNHVAVAPLCARPSVILNDRA